MSKMPNKRKICNENSIPNQSIYIESLQSYYQTESVLNSAYRKVLDFKENAEKILEKEKGETLNLDEFAKAILDSRSFEISLQHNCIKLKCYITLEKDKDLKKKPSEQTSPPSTPLATSPCMNGYIRTESTSSFYADQLDSQFHQANNSTGGAKKVNVEVIMKSNPFRVEENEKTTRMELIKTENTNGNMLRFTYYVKPECEKFKENNSELYENGRLVVFTNDFFTVYQDMSNGQMNISLNEIVQSNEEKIRTEALGEKLFLLLKERPRHRALLTNECKLNHSTSSGQVDFTNGNNAINSQEDETYYTRELINIYGQPIVPSFHKHFNYQLSNTHYGYRTLRRLLNCDILKRFVKITKEEIKSLDRVVEFVQLTPEKCLNAFQLNITCFYDPVRFENGIVKNWLDVWYVDRLKEKYSFCESNSTSSFSSLCTSPSSVMSSSSCSSLPITTNMFSSLSLSNSSWSTSNQNFLSNKTNCLDNTECDQANHLWFCLKDYSCDKMEQFVDMLNNYIQIRCNKSHLISIQTAHPIFEYKSVLSETRRILAVYLNKSTITKTLDELVDNKYPTVAKDHIQYLLGKFLNIDEERKITGFTALFEILMILKRELSKEKNDEMKYSHFLCTLERANQEKLKQAIVQLKCVPCLNKFTTNFNLSTNSSTSSVNCSSSSLNNKTNMVSQANMSRLLKQMSLIVSTELQHIAIDLVERIYEEKPVKFIRLKEEFRTIQSQSNSNNNSLAASSQLVKQQQQQINQIQMQMKNSIQTTFAKKLESTKIFNPKKDLEQFMSHEKKSQEICSFKPSMERTGALKTFMYSERY